MGDFFFLHLGGVFHRLILGGGEVLLHCFQGGLFGGQGFTCGLGTLLGCLLVGLGKSFALAFGHEVLLVHPGKVARGAEAAGGEN